MYVLSVALESNALRPAVGFTMVPMRKCAVNFGNVVQVAYCGARRVGLAGPLERPRV